MKINDHNIVTAVVIGSSIILVLLTLAGLFFVSLKFAGSVFAGGMLALANFLWMATALKRVLSLPVTVAARFALLRYLLRLTVMGIAIYFLIVHVGIDIFGLLLGLSVLVLSVTGLALYKMTLKGG